MQLYCRSREWTSEKSSWLPQRTLTLVDGRLKEGNLAAGWIDPTQGCGSHGPDRAAQAIRPALDAREIPVRFEAETVLANSLA
jgi:hypothetical protein